jgi:hypothetical protein
LIPKYLQLCDDLEARIKDSTLTERQDDIDNNYIEISYAAAAYKSIDTEQNTSKKFVLCYCFTLILTFSYFVDAPDNVDFWLRYSVDDCMGTAGLS